jgi:hypothetical protein
LVILLWSVLGMCTYLLLYLQDFCFINYLVSKLISELYDWALGFQIY